MMTQLAAINRDTWQQYSRTFYGQNITKFQLFWPIMATAEATSPNPVSLEGQGQQKVARGECQRRVCVCFFSFLLQTKCQIKNCPSEPREQLGQNQQFSQLMKNRSKTTSLLKFLTLCELKQKRQKKKKHKSPAQYLSIVAAPSINCR